MSLKKLAKKAMGVVLSAALITGLTPALGASPSASAATAGNKAPVFQFAKNAGWKYTDAYRDVVFTEDGGYLVMGYTFGDSYFPKWTYESEAEAPSGKHTNNDAVLVKYNKDNEVEWSRAYGGTGNDIFDSIDILKDGRIAACGRQSFTSSDSKIKNVSWSIFLIDPENPKNYKDIHIGGTAGDQSFSLAATEDGGFIVGGWSGSKEGYLTSSDDRTSYTETVQLWEAANGTNEAVPNRVASSGSDSVVVKLDAEGQPQWCSLQNCGVSDGEYNITTPSERLEAMTLDGNGDVIITGYDAVAKEAQNAVIAKLSGKDGKLIWHKSAGKADRKTVPTDKADYIKATYSGVATLADGSYVTVGTSTGDAETEEGWRITATKDTIVTHYSADGDVIHAESFGRADDNNSRPEGVTATPDGGYIVFGSQSGVLYEKDLIQKGYDWGNYGAQDAIMIKYSAGDQLEWCDNYGTTNGDWFNGVAVSEDGQMVVVGESNGKFGKPSYKNNGGLDGIVLVSDGTSTHADKTSGIVKDGNVTWADGTYSASGTGYNEAGIEMEVTVEGNRITDVKATKQNETDAYYHMAETLFHTILEKQTSDVDTITGATLSSNGILEGTEKALSQASAKTVDDMIAAIGTAGSDADKKAATSAAADAYAQLGSYAVDALTRLEELEQAAETYGIKLTTKNDIVGLKETLPEIREGAYNDRYSGLQQEYYESINASALAKAGLTGEGVKLAVLDSGITGAHQDLDYGLFLEGYDYDNDKAYNTADSPLIDNNGHGTAVASIIAAKADNEIGMAGLLSKVQIIPLKITPVNNPKKEADSIASSELVARAIRDAVDVYGASVITTSLDVMATDALKEAVEYAASKNVIITGASGNSSKADSTGEDAYIYPAAYDEVISVGAVDKTGQVRTTSQKNDQVFVTAPGENIVLAYPSRHERCTISSGTSYASPIVAAMAVAAKQKNPEMTVDAFKQALMDSSLDAGTEGYDPYYGYGIVDMKAFTYALKNSREIAAENDAIQAELDQAKQDVAEKEAALEEANSKLEEAIAQAEKAAEQQKTQAEADQKKSQAAVDKAQAKVVKAQAELKAAKAKVAVLTVQAKSVKKVKAKAGKKKATVSWKKLGKGYTYKVFKATKINGKYKAVKKKAIAKNKLVVKKLKKKKTYYFKVQAYKKVAGKTVKTQFSEIVSVKVK